MQVFGVGCLSLSKASIDWVRGQHVFYQTQALNCACMRPSTLALVEEI